MPIPTAPKDVNWSGLSPRGREALAQIGMRIAAGYQADEIAELVEVERHELKHLPLPRRDGRVTRNWIAGELRELRAELVKVSD